jgi:hypothetical protein
MAVACTHSYLVLRRLVAKPPLQVKVPADGCPLRGEIARLLVFLLTGLIHTLSLYDCGIREHRAGAQNQVD